MRIAAWIIPKKWPDASMWRRWSAWVKLPAGCQRRPRFTLRTAGASHADPGASNVTIFAKIGAIWCQTLTKGDKKLAFGQNFSLFLLNI